MYLISELAERVGLSRTTLLYYEKLGLIHGKRQANGYRVYSDKDRQRLKLLQHLQAGGLSLQECKSSLNGKLDYEVLAKRLEALEQELIEKTKARELLSALLGQGSLKDWHEELQKNAPDLHQAWLETQGFSEAEAARLVWLSKDMNAHDEYMKQFMSVFNGLSQWGPSSQAATLKALGLVPFAPQRILEIGCGPGAATLILAEATHADILASDTDQNALSRLQASVASKGLKGRVRVCNIDMSQLPSGPKPFDLVWSEGSAYILGVERALREWQRHLSVGGVLAFSDMVWRTENPPEKLKTYWASEYPDMATVQTRLSQAKRAGYHLLGHFDMGREAMDSYYRPLEARVRSMQEELKGTRVWDDLCAEISAYYACDGIVSFEMFVLQKTPQCCDSSLCDQVG